MENYIIPNYIQHIYDVFYNVNGQIIIIVPAETDPLKIQYFDTNTNTYCDFNLHSCPHKHTYIYYLHAEYSEHITLLIQPYNNPTKYKLYTRVNKYPELNDSEIIFSTIVKNENNYITQWIEFHKNIGVSRFIIYDNSDNYDLGNILLPLYFK